MDVNWSMVWIVFDFVLTIALALVAVWLKNGRDLVRTKEAVAKLIGDALAQVAAYAKKIGADVPDAELDNFSGGVYDFWVPRLPDGLPALVLALYPKPQFQALFRKVWREYMARTPALTAAVKRQV